MPVRWPPSGKALDGRVVAGSSIEVDLAAYIAVLGSGAEQTSRAEDRTTYRQHLAAAALMFASLHRGDLKGFKALLASERCAYGWGFLAGDCGAAAEAAWTRFAELAEAHVGRGAVPQALAADADRGVE